MRSIAILTAAIALGATSAQAQNTPSPAPTPSPAAQTPLQLEVALRGYTADNRERSLAGDSTTDKIERYVWADRSLCGVGSGNAAPSGTPWVGWHFTGSVQTVTQESGRGTVAFKVEWQRIWQNGARVTDGPKGESSSSLREGERLELDRVTGGAADACGVTQVRLEVGATGRPAYRLEYFGSRGLRGAHTLTLPATDFFSNGFAWRPSASLVGFTREPATYDAEIWLVHRHPDGKETTERTTVRFSGADLPFTFAPVVVPTSSGDVTLDFSGTLRSGTGPDVNGSYTFFFRPGQTLESYRVEQSSNSATDKQPRIAVAIVRRARASSTPPLDTRGGSYFFMDVPSPSDVVSFEFPSMPAATEALLKGHTFSLRIRVTPAAK